MNLNLSSLGLQSAHKRFLEANEKYSQEQAARDAVRFSPEYLAKVNEAQVLLDEAEEMLPPVSSEELQEAKKVLQKELSDQGLSHCHRAKLNEIGFCSECNSPCLPEEQTDLEHLFDLFRIPRK